MKRDIGQLSSRVYDVLVIGGGIYGVCVAWDAALRGLSVALVEKGDFGHATSSNTLRVIHGGLRYLQHGDLRRMRQSSYEQCVFRRIAPHLVRPLPFLIPTYGHLTRGKAALFLALRIQDFLKVDQDSLGDSQETLPPGRVISREECLRLLPDLDASGLSGGAIFSEFQMDNSERLVLSFAQSAVRAGADLANYVEVTGLLREGRRVIGAVARDRLAGGEIEVRARVVINASGPWADQVWGLLNGQSRTRKVLLSKAFNIATNRQLIPQYAVGLYLRGHPKPSRLVVITPWHAGSLIGTAHLPYDGEPDNCRISEAECESFLNDVNKAYPPAALKREDLSCLYGGLLPMAGADPRTNQVRLVRRNKIHDHQEAEAIEGFISIIGVKFTEARLVAEKVIDLVMRKLEKPPTPSRSPHTLLYGAPSESFNAFLAEQIRKRSAEFSAGGVRRLVHQYGSAYTDVLKYLGEKASSSGRSSVSGDEARTLLEAETRHAAREEMAQRLADVVFRRTTVGRAGEAGGAGLDICAEAMARELGWDPMRKAKELEEVRAACHERT